MMRTIARRSFLTGLTAASLLPAAASAQSAAFERWVAGFRAKAVARGISDATYTRVMVGLKPDTSVYELQSNQDEFNEKLWQYINRRASDWRIITGKQRAKDFAPLLTSIEKNYGVDRYILLGLWGVESSYGELIDNRNYMRPVIPALAALAFGEPRRRAYWEQELLNALRIVDRGWSNPDEMIGSWAGAMGHTQWMPEVWLAVGVDYDHDGHISPFGKPDDALAGTARYLVERGKYRRGEAWGYEVKGSVHTRGAPRSYARWQAQGVVRADGGAFPRPADRARLIVPVDGGPAFLIGQNFSAVKSYNPAFSYALAIVHLADRIRGLGSFVRSFPGGERLPTLTEIQEIQRRLTEQGFDTGGSDGRVGVKTMRAIQAYQRKNNITPTDGYAGISLLSRLRQSG